MMKYAKNLYMWMLMTLMLGGTAHAQSKTDIEYDRAIQKISQMDGVKIDTVVLNSPGSGYRTFGSHDCKTDLIIISYFLEKYDLSHVRDMTILEAKKYVRNTVTHEMKHRSNNKIRQKIIFRDINEETLFSIYDETTARISELIEFRKQLQELKRENKNKFTLTDIFGNRFKSIPKIYREKINNNDLYTKDFQYMHKTYSNHYLYITYVVNHPEILDTDTIYGEEADYILMSALTQMDRYKDLYSFNFAYPKTRPQSQRLLYFYATLEKMNLDKDTPVFPGDFAPEFKKLGFNDASKGVEYHSLVDALNNRSDLIPSDTQILDQSIPEMFTFDNFNLYEKLSPMARKSLEKFVSEFMISTQHVSSKQDEDFINQRAAHNRTLQKMYDISLNNPPSNAIQQKLHAATDKLQNKLEKLSSNRVSVPSIQKQMD